MNDLILFHKVVYKIIPIDLPNYLTPFTGQSRLRSSHMDELSFVSNLISRTTNTTVLEKSFFYRTYMTWNSIPLEIRKLGSISLFRSKIEAHLWSLILRTDNGESGAIGTDLDG